MKLTPWGPDDFDVLLGTNSAEMTEFLGGPETDAQLRNRHERYVKLTSTGPGCMFVIVHDSGEKAGSIGFWAREWEGAEIYEAGWGVLPAYQGQGLAAEAAIALTDLARVAAVRERAAGGPDRRYVHAFPGVDHPASNATCRKAGFVLIGECEFEYPKGTIKFSNDWRFDLFL